MDLSRISSLSRGELQGWHAVVTHPGEPWGRLPAQGEVSALLTRAAQLGMTLSAATSRADLFGSATGMPNSRQGSSGFTRS